MTNIAPVGSVAAGKGRYGQSDLAGDVFEWALAGHEHPYPLSESTNYSNTTTTYNQAVRGGGFSNDASSLLVSYRYGYPPQSRSDDLGSRCARTP
ncbi:MAG: SUMF1/EgtB/PvdO family nonheme iron enzyme [Sorangiineae bacterium]|nr:SUMF1/EgtB/PvdO family nonheme iron enzyme [Polyangiaceae bacterium]MEB2323362.1 SUMF1/EgtB/PvdO family nonheme iron enzyme [Sorangiineae bacterium]